MRILALLSAILVATSPILAADIAAHAPHGADELSFILASTLPACQVRCAALFPLLDACTSATSKPGCSALCATWDQVAACVQCDMLGSGASESDVREALARMAAVCGGDMPAPLVLEPRAPQAPSSATLIPTPAIFPDPSPVTLSARPPSSSAGSASTSQNGPSKVLGAPGVLTSPPPNPTVNPYSPKSGGVRIGAATMTVVAACVSLVFL